MHRPTERIAHATAFVTPDVEHWLEREIAQLVHPMKENYITNALNEFHKSVFIKNNLKKHKTDVFKQI